MAIFQVEAANLPELPVALAEGTERAASTEERPVEEPRSDPFVPDFEPEFPASLLDENLPIAPVYMGGDSPGPDGPGPDGPGPDGPGPGPDGPGPGPDGPGPGDGPGDGG
jgi:hypothetical protein